MRMLFRIAPFAGAFMLAGCLVSDAPLFDASNAAETPLAAGDYQACSGSTDEDAVECSPMTVKLADGLYTFLIEDDSIGARFHAIDEDDYAVQMDDDDGDGFQYYWARKTADGVALVVLWCEDLPRAFVDKLAAEGGLDPDADYQTCTAKTADAVIATAKAYAAGEVVKQNWVKLAPAAAAQ